MHNTDTVEMPFQALRNLQSLPLELVRPVLKFITSGNASARVWCLAFHPALAVQLAVAGHYVNTPAWHALRLLDAGAIVPEVLKRARF